MEEGEAATRFFSVTTSGLGSEPWVFKVTGTPLQEQLCLSLLLRESSRLLELHTAWVLALATLRPGPQLDAILLLLSPDCHLCLDCQLAAGSQLPTGHLYSSLQAAEMEK